MYYIGIDLGTSAIKLLLMEGNGKICNIVSKEYPLSFPNPGWSEQNPYDWYDQMIAGIKELVNGFDTTKVAGISFGGQMHGLVMLDENDEVIGYKFVNLGKMMDAIRKGTDPKDAYEKNIGTYGRYDEAAKHIDPRNE